MPVSQVPIQETNKYTGKLFPIGLAIWFRIDVERHVRRNTTVERRMGKLYIGTSTDKRRKLEISAFENYFLKHQCHISVKLFQTVFPQITAELRGGWAAAELSHRQNSAALPGARGSCFWCKELWAPRPPVSMDLSSKEVSNTAVSAAISQWPHWKQEDCFATAFISLRSSARAGDSLCFRLHSAEPRRALPFCKTQSRGEAGCGQKQWNHRAIGVRRDF